MFPLNLLYLVDWSLRKAAARRDTLPTVHTKPSSTRMKSIVLIEDNRDNRLLVRALVSEFYVLKEYETGFEALEGMKSMIPDLILLDISLPGMDGVEVLSRLRSDERLRSIPVIALTAHAMSGDRERYLRAGFDDYVAKPIIDEDVLLQAIARALPPALKQ